MPLVPKEDFKRWLEVIEENGFKLPAPLRKIKREIAAGKLKRVVMKFEKIYYGEGESN